MSIPLRLEDVRRAWDARDPELVGLVEALASRPDPKPEVPIRDGAPTFAKFLAEIRGKPFRRKPREEQAHERIERIKALESTTAEVPLPDRLRLHEVLFALWEDDGPFARSCLLAIIARVKLAYGPWRALKRIFKEAEARDDSEVFGGLAARFDMALARGDQEVGRDTLAYLSRRAWRRLRRTAQTLPVAYADAAAGVLAHYDDSTNWQKTWVANQIFYHETGRYNRGQFTFSYHEWPGDLLEHRAFADLWRRSPRPLFSLLERAKSDKVREFAADALKTDFRAVLREVEPAWVARLVNVGSRSIDEFVVWILNNVPKFEQAAFRTLGLHGAVLRLFDSPASGARAYAADYARTHARDLPVEQLIRLANNDHQGVRKLAGDLLLSRDPRKDIGLDAWGQLLEKNYAHELAATVLRKHFGAKELTPAWFKARLFSGSPTAFQFAKTLLPQVHPIEKLGVGFFRDLIEDLDDPTGASSRFVAAFALGELGRFDLNALDRDFLKRLLIHPLTSEQAGRWVDEARLKARTLPVDDWKVLAYHPDWDADPWVAALKESGRTWARSLAFNETLADRVLGWLKDVRRFGPAEIGFDWLLGLVVRGEPRYRDFASETMIKGFVPADFAPRADSPATTQASPTEVDLAGATFLFTGKLATMSRKEAEDKVKAVKGAVASVVSAKLHYLVIGDEGSPLYGHGKKGAKQLKAEEVNAAGGNIKIISETAFLQMLAGTSRAFSSDASIAGSQRLWEMATAPGPADAPLAQFAIKYLRRHHPDIGPAETARPVDPGAEVPAAFLTFEQVKPLFAETRKPLRDFALELARWEFTRWSPPIEKLLNLSEIPHADVREFVAQALLAEDTPEHRHYRIDPAVLTPAAVYSFCESADAETRALGMELIRRSPRLQVPEELFRLTESPDRMVRAFVIRALWSLYRDRGIKADWKPFVPPQTTVGAAAKKAAATAVERRGEGAPARPEHLPASPLNLWHFLRRSLFEVPPTRPQASKAEGEEIKDRVKPLPARKAKLGLVEVMRDLALEEADFARGVLPILREFMTSRGKSEHDACLVAVTQIQHAHPIPRQAVEGVAP